MTASDHANTVREALLGNVPATEWTHHRDVALAALDALQTQAEAAEAERDRLKERVDDPPTELSNTVRAALAALAKCMADPRDEVRGARAAVDALEAQAKDYELLAEDHDTAEQRVTAMEQRAVAAEARVTELQVRYDTLAATIKGKTAFDVVAEKVDAEIRLSRAEARVTELVDLVAEAKWLIGAGLPHTMEWHDRADAWYTAASAALAAEHTQDTA